jgi:hypothetical protein
MSRPNQRFSRGITVTWRKLSNLNDIESDVIIGAKIAVIEGSPHGYGRTAMLLIRCARRQ